MNKARTIISLAVLTIGLLGSCSKINERIDGLDKRINNLENDKIASVEQQIAAINQSIADLGTIRTNIQTLMDAKEAQGEDITVLKAKDQELEGKINDLKAYVDTDLAKYATKDWANATFATLEKQAEIIADVTKLKQDLAGLDAELDQAIEDLDSSLKAWVNEQLSAYSTTAQMEAKIKALQDQIDALKADNETNKSDIEELEAGLAELEEDLAAAKESIKTAYEKAIKDALESNNGYITEKIKRAISSANGSISSLSSRVGTLETQVDALLKDVDDLKGMIQSVTIIPAYSDGSVEVEGNNLKINFIVSPASALENVTKDDIKVLVNTVKTKSLTYTTVSATIATINESNGEVTITANISSIHVEDDEALTVAINVKNGISDYTTNFVPVTLPRTFKAVYNTTGDANTLTFYYDAVDHSGAGITVYDNLPTAATQPTSWGYDGVRSNIVKVEITESVKNYKGLTSTACMFQNMTAASDISGAEYLDVPKVTNMMAMFWNFGSNSSTLSSVPDVKDWNTGKVENMQNMFMNYGAGPIDFNDVPDVSKWNTASVTNMTNMFLGYGNKSEILNAVPDVKEWNTASVTNMNSMFESYGNSSNNLDKVPDVSGWNTINVTDMGDMFLKYGNTSTALNTVPDVNGWNTINVTIMTNMFQNYGYSSTALSTVPYVSNWETGKVTSMTNMFKGYGNTSTNIICELNLSGWDLSKITSGDDVFNFNPGTFEVWIPAKTGDRDNAEDKWYYGNGDNFITPPTGKTFTTLGAG